MTGGLNAVLGAFACSGTAARSREQRTEVEWDERALRLVLDGDDAALFRISLHTENLGPMARMTGS